MSCVANNYMQRAPAQVVIGTAGHVDHGKTSLIKALTGTDPDRLPQEKQRGLTIELGFAFLIGAENNHSCDLGFVDCPGHSKFLRHAIAGMGAMNGCLLVIAADEGIAAQTREHLDLLRLLDVHWGRIIISKSVLVGEQRLQTLSAQCLELCAGTPFALEKPLCTDAHTGLGMSELREWLFEQAEARLGLIQEQQIQAPARLGIDRVFTVKGHGTVVTGTLLSGSLQVGDAVQCFPGPQARIRGVQVRSLTVQQAIAGQRCAINLAGVECDNIERGAWLAPVNSLQPTQRIDILADVIEPGLRHGDALRIHHGTAAHSGRIMLFEHKDITSGQAIAQLRLDSPLYLDRGDQLVLRRPSPSATVGAARVLAVDAQRHKRFHVDTRKWFADLQSASATQLTSWLQMRGPVPATLNEAQVFCAGTAALQQAIVDSGETIITRDCTQETFLWSAQQWHTLRESVSAVYKKNAYADITNPWHALDSLRHNCASACPTAAWEDFLKAWQDEGDLLRQQRLICIPALLPEIPSKIYAEIQELIVHYAERGLQAGYNNPECDARDNPPLARQALQIAGARGWLIRLSDRQHIDRQSLQAAVHLLTQAFAANEEVDFQWAKRAFGVSRRYILPILEWCDQNGISLRQGNMRIAGHALADSSEIPVPMVGILPK